VRGLAVALLLAVATPAAGGNPTSWRIAGPAGTMCSKGEKYEAVRVEGKWKALCYKGDLHEARAMAEADPSCVASDTRVRGCVTCPTIREELELEALIFLRRLNHE
jgi:hypothetical protein